MATNYFCDFASETSTCEGETVLLKECTRDIGNHLKKLHLPPNSISNERSLILSRYGIFGKAQNTTRKKHICVFHRDILGLKYKPVKICMHPNHSSARAPEKDRSVSVQCAKEIHEASGKVIAVGAGNMVTYCLVYIILTLTLLSFFKEISNFRIWCGIQWVNHNFHFHCM